MPAFDGSDDLVGIGGPSEGLGLVVLCTEAVDCCLEVDDGVEDTAPERRRFDSFAKKPPRPR